MTEPIEHTGWPEQREFLKLSPSQQNLKIYISSKETNGKLAAAIRDIAEIKPMVRRHDFAFRVAALAFGVIIATGPFIIAFSGR